MNDKITKKDDNLLAKGGGDATTGGVRFQASLGALFGAELIAERPLDRRLGLGDAKPQWIRFETEAPIDDVLVATHVGGFVAVQAKLSLQSSRKMDSEFGKTVDQLVRHYLACRMGDGGREWDRPLDPLCDRLLLAVGPRTSATIRQHLADGLNARRQPGTGAIRPLSAAQEDALADFDACIGAAWETLTSETLTDSIIREVSRLTFVVTFDFDGGDWTAASAVLGTALGVAAEGVRVLTALVTICQDLMATRSGVDELSLRRRLAQSGAKLLPPETYRVDLKALLAYSNRVQEALRRYEEIETVGGAAHHVRRACEGVVLDAALKGSLLIIGEPGAGKSAVINALSRDLQAAGYGVLELAVDRLPVESLEGLGRELGLQHPLLEVLRQWDDSKPGYIIIDALDATRGGASEAVFRTLITVLLSSSDSRWRVVASIRTFDLRLGQQFRTLFKGAPPNPTFADATFAAVRHIKVPTWTPEEKADLFASAPALAEAIAHAPTRLQELANVPFNTRLLAELVSAGIESTEFATVDSQVELLRLYWAHRVQSLGQPADVTLRRVVNLMIKDRVLRARRLDAAEGDATAFQALLQQGVLTTSADDRFVTFRHHLLFDYAASRLYLDPEEIISGAMTFPKTHALGLMLGPALTFVLTELWKVDDDHHSFWECIIRLLGDEDCDPVLRSVAARSASGQPTISEDAVYLADRILAGAEGAVKSATHLVGALAVRLEDEEPTELLPWTVFTARLVASVEIVAWPVRSLCYLLVDRAKDPKDRANLGAAARALLTFGLEQGNTSALVDSAISFVSDTYETDVDASRSLLRKVFEAERFAKYGAEEAPDLAQKIGVIAPIDPDFVVEVYSEIYRKSVTEDRVIQMSSSQILGLTSNARQDFEMARYSLGEFFPKFLVSHPEHSVSALIAAVEGYVAREHTLQEKPEELEVIVEGQRVRLINDLSYIWAWNPDDQYRDDAEVLLAAFCDHMRTAPPEIALRSANCLIHQNRMAVLWARLFMTAAQRPDVFGRLVWPYASAEPFLLAPDTQKDAIDFVAVMYPTIPEETRRQFEVKALEFDFSDFQDQQKARDRFHERIFGTIGTVNLVTEVAKNLLAKQIEMGGNERPFKISTSSGSMEPYWWLKDAKVDLESPANAPLREAIDTTKVKLGLGNGESTISFPLVNAMEGLRSLLTAIVTAESTKADSELLRYAEGILAEGIAKVAGYKQLKEPGQWTLLLELADLVSRSARLPFPEVTADTEERFEQSASWGGPAPRVDAAQAALTLSMLHVEIYHRLRPDIDNLLRDSHPAVRLTTATALVRIWDIDRTAMWELAQVVIRNEQNLAILHRFANRFLGATLHHDPEQVENLALELLQRFSADIRENAKNLARDLGAILALLWVSHERHQAGELLQEWITNVVPNAVAIEQAIKTLRNVLVLGYEEEEPKERGIRHRSQDFVVASIMAAAQRQEELLNQAQLTEQAQAEVRTCAKLIDTACSQIFFASGAFKSSKKEDKGLPPGTARLMFLDELEGAFRRIGEVGTPHTIYYLLQLFEFLLPSDPPRVFDLSAHALLRGGRQHGYQYESLGADLLVRMVGQCLADYRGIFEDVKRRQLLIDCLETFLAAGWPAARRLLYRLPELLQ